MAHVFVGNAPRANVDLLDAFLDLDDTYWVFAEFTVGSGTRGRQVDWMILRAVPDDRPVGVFSTLIVGEQKETTASVTGLENSVWTEHRNGADSPLIMSNRGDLNPLQQAINIANAVKDWLWNNERLFIDLARLPVQANDFNVWPTLVILSPPDVLHRLPHRLTYGAIWYGVDAWLSSIKGWVPRRGLQLTRVELERLAALVAESSGIAPWVRTSAAGDEPPAEPEPEVDAEVEPVDVDHLEQTADVGIDADADADTDVDATTDPTLTEPVSDGVGGPGWLNGLADWVRATERRLELLESSQAPRPTPPTKVSIRPDDRFTAEERRMVETAIRRVRDRNGKPDFPNVFSELHRLGGGEPLSRRNFLGWGSGRNMMDQAVAEGWLEYGPVDRNDLPTLYLARESL